MRKVISLILIVSVLCSSIVGSTYAAQIETKEFSSSEAQELSIEEVHSMAAMEEIVGGGGDDEAMLIIFAVVGVLALIAAAASS